MAKRKTTDYLPDPSNANTGSERGLRALDDSLSKYGAGRSILVDKNGYVIGGNKTLERAVDLGFDDVIEVETDGRQLVAVRRTDLDLLNDPKARELAYADNRVSELDLTWNAEQLLADLNAGVDLTAFWREDELQALLDGLVVTPAQDPGAQVDKAAELQQKWGVSRGDLWEIGKHRLLCGDSTNADDVARVMAGERYAMVFTDPPYGINYDHASTGRAAQKFHKLENDELQGQAFSDFLAAFFRAILPCQLDNASYYVCGANRTAHMMVMAAEAVDLHYAVPLVWVKQHFALNWDRYHPQHEWIFYGGEGSKPTGNASRWFGPNNESTVWQIDRDHSGDYEHPTQKPVELPSRAITNSSTRDEIILDGFGGSGTTMVACEQLGRVCRMIEIAPEYCSVILERMSGMGIEPRRVSE